MAIVLHAIESVADRMVTALIEHGGRRFSASVAGDPDRLRAAIGAPLLVELDYQVVRSFRVLEHDDPVAHGLFPLPSGDIRVVGAVHNIMRFPSTPTLVDVYLQTGPEFITFEADALGEEPMLGTGIEVVVAGLCFYPTWT
jgi:hypothetical protein